MATPRNTIALAAFRATGAGPHRHRAAPRAGDTLSLVRTTVRCPTCDARDPDCCPCPDPA